MNVLDVHERSMQVDYDHDLNVHTVDSPRAVVPLLFGERRPQSLLDVGCGIGTWMAAARELGIPDVLGIDGVILPAHKLLVPPDTVAGMNLASRWDLGRRFDVALCLEVAEHLDERFAVDLIQSLTSHAERVVFSAACPGQPGQHHVNCQWPVYWQELFNRHGFACDDEIRWRIWDDPVVDVWYRQNMFVALREPSRAGREARLRPVVHPAFVEEMAVAHALRAVRRNMEYLRGGAMPMQWYASLGLQAVGAKVRRRLG